MDKQLLDKYNIPEEEAGIYKLSEEMDYKILSEILKLERKDLSENDRAILEFCKTQLLDDWRAPLINKIEEIVKKYN